MKKKDYTTGAAEKQQPTMSSSKPIYVKALALVGITTGYIFGPMVLFGSIGWWLYTQFGGKYWLFGGFLLALVVSNFLIFRNTERALKKM